MKILNLLTQLESGVREVIQSLTAADEEHLQGLLRFAAARGLPVTRSVAASGG